METLDSTSFFWEIPLLNPVVTEIKKNKMDFFNLNKLFENDSNSTNHEFKTKIDSANNEDSMLSYNLKKVSLKCYPFATQKDSTQNALSLTQIHLNHFEY